MTFNDNNKFILGFSNEEFVQKIKFFKRKDYFITSLNCNLKLKTIIKEHKKKEIEELSKISNLLLEKDYQDDIGYMILDTAPYFDFKDFALTYNYKKDSRITKKDSFKDKFIDLKDQTIKDCEIWSPFQPFQNQGFLSKRVKQPNPNNTFIIKLFQDNKKIEGNFTGDFLNLSHYTSLTQRDLNSIYIFDEIDQKWYVTDPILFFQATKEKIFNKNFDIAEFYHDHFCIKKKNWIYNW